MERVYAQQTVGEVVAAAPLTARVFERLGIDFCCGGRVALEVACREKGLDLAAVIAEIEGVGAEDAGDSVDWNARSLSELIDHILDRHHVYLKREFPRLVALARKVESAHGARHPELFPALARHVVALAEELDLHMMKEEQVLFPAIRALEEGVAGGPMMHCGGIDAPISVMEYEHEEAGRVLAAMRTLTQGYVPPGDACNSFRALYAGLEDLEKDLHLHIHLENNLLHPRALELARAGCRH